MLKDIIRFKQKGKKELIHYKVTQEQAQEWCESDLTKGKGYFDGFDNTGTHAQKQNPKYSHYFTPNENYH